MTYHLAQRRRRGLGATASGGAVPVVARPGDTGVVGSRTDAVTPPPGYNVAIAAQVLRYPVTELNALNGYDAAGTVLFPNADLKVMSQREIDGVCTDVMKKIFLVDLYERARAALQRLLAYQPQGFEQKAWYEASQAWMEIWCRSTATRGGTFRAAMAETRLLPVGDSDNFAPFPESNNPITGGGDGQTLAWTMNTLGLSGWTAKKTLGTPRDFFGFTSPWDVPDARETPYLCWPPAGPDEQFFGFPIWATLVFQRYRNAVGSQTFINTFRNRHAALIQNCGWPSPFSKNRGALTGQRVQPLDLAFNPIPKGTMTPAGKPTWPTDLTNCVGSSSSGDELRGAMQDLRAALHMTTDLNALATGSDTTDDKDWLWQQTGTDPLDAYVAVIDACTSVGNTQNPFEIFYQAMRNYASNPVGKISSDMWSQFGCSGAVYWQTGKVVTGKMMCDALRPRMQEMAGLEFMQVLSTSLTQYAAYLQMPENKAIAGESADQIAAAADAAAQAGIQTAAQVTVGIGAGIAAFAGIGTIIGGIVAGIGALLGILGGLIHAQAYAPVPLWYRVLSHCKGGDLALASAAQVKAYLDKLQLQIKSKTAAASQVANAYLAGLKGDGYSGSTKTWKLAAYTVGGVMLAGIGALAVRHRRDRGHAPAVQPNRRRRRTR